MKTAEKDRYPEIYGYSSPNMIPGNQNGITVNYLRFVDIDGDHRFVAVSKELFEYVRNEESKEFKKYDRMTRCWIPGQRDNIIKCREKCDECPYGKEKRDNYLLSLDSLYDAYNYEVVDNSPSIEEKLIEEELYQKLREEIRKLDDTNRTIITLSYYENHSDSEIGRILGIPRSTIEWRRQKALNILKEKLKNYR